MMHLLRMLLAELIVGLLELLGEVGRVRGVIMRIVVEPLREADIVIVNIDVIVDVVVVVNFLG